MPGSDAASSSIAFRRGSIDAVICRARMMLVAALDGGVLPDSRHDFVIEGNALDLLFAEMRRAANVDGRQRLVA